MEISAFLNKEEPNMKLSEYEIVVKSVCNDQRRVITAKICSELNISRTKWQSRNTVFY